MTCPSHLSVSHLRPWSKQSLKPSSLQDFAAKSCRPLTRRSSSTMDKAIPSASALSTSGLKLFCHHFTLANLKALLSQKILASWAASVSSQICRCTRLWCLVPAHRWGSTCHQACYSPSSWEENSCWWLQPMVPPCLQFEGQWLPPFFNLPELTEKWLLQLLPCWHTTWK